jgi:hypothetical protein
MLTRPAVRKFLSFHSYLKSTPLVTYFITGMIIGLLSPSTVFAEDDEYYEEDDASVEANISAPDFEDYDEVDEEEEYEEDEEEINLTLEIVEVVGKMGAKDLQDIPIAISVLSGEDLAKQGVTNIQNLSESIPGLSLESGAGTGGAAAPYIRGIGQRDSNETLEGGVAIYVDGVYMGRPDGALLDMIDVAKGGAVRRIVVKPARSSLALAWAIAVWTPSFTEFLHSFLVGHRSRAEAAPELFIGDVIQAAIDRGMKVDAVCVSEEPFLDIGTPEGLARSRSFSKSWQARL